jgi:hypothetical protein
MKKKMVTVRAYASLNGYIEFDCSEETARELQENDELMDVNDHPGIIDWSKELNNLEGYLEEFEIVESTSQDHQTQDGDIMKMKS